MIQMSTNINSYMLIDEIDLKKQALREKADLQHIFFPDDSFDYKQIYRNLLSKKWQQEQTYSMKNPQLIQGFSIQNFDLEDKSEKGSLHLQQQNAQLNSSMKAEISKFEEEYIQEVKFRSKCFVEEDQYINFEQILKKYKMIPGDVKKILGHTAKMLLFYEIYFNDLILSKNNEEIWKKCQEQYPNQTQFLQNLFANQRAKRNQYAMGDIQSLLKSYLPMYKFPTAQEWQTKKCLEEKGKHKQKCIKIIRFQREQ